MLHSRLFSETGIYCLSNISVVTVLVQVRLNKDLVFVSLLVCRPPKLVIRPISHPDSSHLLDNLEDHQQRQLQYQERLGACAEVHLVCLPGNVTLASEFLFRRQFPSTLNRLVWLLSRLCLAMHCRARSNGNRRRRFWTRLTLELILHDRAILHRDDSVAILEVVCLMRGD